MCWYSAAVVTHTGASTAQQYRPNTRRAALVYWFNIYNRRRMYETDCWCCTFVAINKHVLWFSGLLCIFHTSYLVPVLCIISCGRNVFFDLCAQQPKESVRVLCRITAVASHTFPAHSTEEDAIFAAAPGRENAHNYTPRAARHTAIPGTCRIPCNKQQGTQRYQARTVYTKL